MKKVFSVLIYPFLAFCFIIYLLSHPLECTFYTSKSISVCAKSLIPSLFPFIFASKYLACVTPVLKKSCFITRFFAKIFGICENLVPCVILGLFSGFPTGAIYSKEAYCRNLCNKKQAVRSTILSSNCSAAFLMGTASIAVLDSVKYGAVIVTCQALSVITVSQLLKLLYGTTYSNKEHFSDKTSFTTKPVEAFTKSLKESCISMLFISGFVVFFSLVYGIICDNLTSLNHYPVVLSLLGASFELSTGILSCGKLLFPLNVVMCAFCASFPSLSVLFQIKSICDDYFDITSQFIFSHLCISLLSAIFSCLFLCTFPSPVLLDFILFPLPFIVIITCFTIFSMLNKSQG